MTILARLLAPESRPSPVRKPGLKAYNAIAEAAGTLRQYQDVPVRFQKQWITVFLAVMVAVSIVAGFYLNVAAQKGITGREIQALEEEINVNEHTNADLQTELAILLSSKVLEERARAEGFVPLENSDIKYLVVPGYFPPEGVNMSSLENESYGASTPLEYSESLLGWISRQLEAGSIPLAKAN